MLPTASFDIKGLSLADSVAMDPHKWLYAPLEAGCALVRSWQALQDTFHYYSTYYQFDTGEEPLNYHENGPQNSRGLRALKVWLALRQIGREGYERQITEVIQLSEEMCRQITAYPELEVCPSAEQYHLPLRSHRSSTRLRVRRSLSQSSEHCIGDTASTGRRGIYLQRRGAGKISAARLHRELPHLPGGCGSSASHCVPPGTRN